MDLIAFYREQGTPARQDSGRTPGVPERDGDRTPGVRDVPGHPVS
jgi:hypothetical protein